MKPLVSAIIPNYNYARYVGEAVESALGQTYPNIEVIVVDDGSKDNSLEVLEKYRKRIKIIEQENSGVCVARNRGVAESKGEYIAFLDADDVWLPEKIAIQIHELEESPGAVFTNCGMQLIDPDGKPLGSLVEGKSGNVTSTLLGFNEPATVGIASTGLVSRRIFETISGFDTRLSTAADWDFCFRLSRLGEFIFIPKPLVKYRMHNSNMHGNIHLMEKDMVLCFDKAFAEVGEHQDRRDEYYGNLFRVLAGSYFRSGQYSDFLRTAAKSVWYRPAGIGYFAAFPFRKFSKLRMKTNQSGETKGGGESR